MLSERERTLADTGNVPGSFLATPSDGGAQLVTTWTGTQYVHFKVKPGAEPGTFVVNGQHTVAASSVADLLDHYRNHPVQAQLELGDILAATTTTTTTTTTTVFDAANIDCFEEQDVCTVACQKGSDRNYILRVAAVKNGRACVGPRDCVNGDGLCVRTTTSTSTSTSSQTVTRNSACDGRTDPAFCTEWSSQDCIGTAAKAMRLKSNCQVLCQSCPTTTTTATTTTSTTATTTTTSATTTTTTVFDYWEPSGAQCRRCTGEHLTNVKSQKECQNLAFVKDNPTYLFNDANGLGVCIFCDEATLAFYTTSTTTTTTTTTTYTGTTTTATTTTTTTTTQRQCSAGEYLAASNNRCQTCPSGTFRPDKQHYNRACQPWIKCSPAQYQAQRPTSTNDRTCMTITVCTADQYELAAPNATSDRECTGIKTCMAGYRVTKTPTATSDRVCTACVEGISYQDSVNQPRCKLLAYCGPNQYALGLGSVYEDARDQMAMLMCTRPALRVLSAARAVFAVSRAHFTCAPVPHPLPPPKKKHTHTHVPLPFFLNHHTHSTACVLCRCPAALARTATNKSAGSTCWPSVRQRARPQQPRQLRPRPRKPRPRPLPLPPQLPPRLRRQRPPPLPQPRRSGNAHQGSSFRATHARRAQMGRFVPMMRTTTVRATRG